MQSIDIHRSHRQLLEELRVAASRAMEDQNPAYMTVTFAVLLVKLSEQADAATRRIVRLTWVLLLLTIILTIAILPPAIQATYEWLYGLLVNLRGYFS